MSSAANYQPNNSLELASLSHMKNSTHDYSPIQKNF